MEDFAITIVLLSIYGSVIGVILWILGQVLPETLQDKIWQKLGLDNNDPYEDYDED